MYGFARNIELYKRHNVNHFLILYSNQRDFFRCCCSDDAFNCMFFVLRIIFNLLVWLFRLDGNINSRVILCKLTPAEVMAINYFVGKSKYVKHRVKLFFHAIDSIRLGSLYWSLILLKICNILLLLLFFFCWIAIDIIIYSRQKVVRPEEY